MGQKNNLKDKLHRYTIHLIGTSKMRKMILFITLLMFVSCNSSNTTRTNNLIGEDIATNAIAKTEENLSSENISNFYDSIKGCWGTHPETGNSILCFTGPDSVFWVDPSVWCKYHIDGDIIIMETTDAVYFQGQIKIHDDSLLLSDFDYTWRYGRHE